MQQHAKAADDAIAALARRLRQKRGLERDIDDI